MACPEASQRPPLLAHDTLEALAGSPSSFAFKHDRANSLSSTRTAVSVEEAFSLDSRGQDLADSYRTRSASPSLLGNPPMSSALHRHTGSLTSFQSISSYDRKSSYDQNAPSLTASSPATTLSLSPMLQRTRASLQHSANAKDPAVETSRTSVSMAETRFSVPTRGVVARSSSMRLSRSEGRSGESQSFVASLADVPIVSDGPVRQGLDSYRWPPPFLPPSEPLPTLPRRFPTQRHKATVSFDHSALQKAAPVASPSMEPNKLRTLRRPRVLSTPAAHTPHLEDKTPGTTSRQTLAPPGRAIRFELPRHPAPVDDQEEFYTPLCQAYTAPRPRPRIRSNPPSPRPDRNKELPPIPSVAAAIKENCDSRQEREEWSNEGEGLLRRRKSRLRAKAEQEERRATEPPSPPVPTSTDTLASLFSTRPRAPSLPPLRSDAFPINSDRPTIHLNASGRRRLARSNSDSSLHVRAGAGTATELLEIQVGQAITESTPPRRSVPTPTSPSERAFVALPPSLRFSSFPQFPIVVHSHASLPVPDRPGNGRTSSVDEERLLAMRLYQKLVVEQKDSMPLPRLPLPSPRLHLPASATRVAERQPSVSNRPSSGSTPSNGLRASASNGSHFLPESPIDPSLPTFAGTDERRLGGASSIADDGTSILDLDDDDESFSNLFFVPPSRPSQDNLDSSEWQRAPDGLGIAHLVSNMGTDDLPLEAGQSTPRRPVLSPSESWATADEGQSLFDHFSTLSHADQSFPDSETESSLEFDNGEEVADLTEGTTSGPQLFRRSSLPRSHLPAPISLPALRRL